MMQTTKDKNKYYISLDRDEYVNESLLNISNKENIIFGGESAKDKNFIQPTLIRAADSESMLLSEEIFGPVLPIYTYSTDEQLSELVDNISKPLALYVFSNNRNSNPFIYFIGI